MTIPIGPLIQGASEARNAFVGGRQKRDDDQLATAMQLLKLKREQEEQGLRDAFMKAQTSKLLQPPAPPAPRNIDPLSKEGITASTERARAEAEATAPFKKDPNAVVERNPIVGSPEWLAAEEARAKIGAKYRPAPSTAPGGMSTSNQLTLQGHFNTDQTVKDAGQIATALRKIRASSTDPSAAGDMALLIGYMKLLDPGSVVREQEFATAAKSGSLPQQIQAAGLRVANGQRLTPEQRADFVSRAEGVARSQNDQFRTVYSRYSDQATRAGLNPRDVVVDPFEGLFEQGGGGRAGGSGLRQKYDAAASHLRAQGKTPEQIRATIGDPPGGQE